MDDQKERLEQEEAAVKEADRIGAGRTDAQVLLRRPSAPHAADASRRLKRQNRRSRPS